MHLEDTARFCPKEERESKQTSFRDQNLRQDQKGAFKTPSRSTLKREMGMQLGPHTNSLILESDQNHQKERCTVLW
uniref:Uncharacterized protein n=2 Tax=Equus TaxID=9789 RepID=A0A9L0T1I5_HORSE